MPKTVTGNIYAHQVKASHRQGDSNVFQMFGGGATAEGDIAVYNALGEVVSGGTLQIEDINPVLGFIVGNGESGNNVGPILIANSAGSFSHAKLVVKSSHASTGLAFNIQKNGVDVFTADQTVAAGTAAGTLVFISGSALTSNPLTFALDDQFTIDITTGSSDWKFTVELRWGGTYTASKSDSTAVSEAVSAVVFSAWPLASDSTAASDAASIEYPQWVFDSTAITDAASATIS